MIEPMIIIGSQQLGHAFPTKEPVESMTFGIKQGSPWNDNNNDTKNHKDNQLWHYSKFKLVWWKSHSKEK